MADVAQARESRAVAGLLLRGLVAWALAIALGVLCGRAVVDTLRPAMEAVTEGLSAEYAPHYYWNDEQPDMLMLRADLLTPHAVTLASGVRRGQVITTGTNLFHALVPPVIVVALVVSWPLRGWRRRAAAGVLAVPAAALSLLLTSPFLLAGKVEALLRAYAANAGLEREGSLVYQWMAMSEGGARWALPLLLALACIALANRLAPPGRGHAPPAA